MTTEFTRTEAAPTEPLLPSVDFSAILSDFRRFLNFFIAVFVATFLAIIVPIMVQTPKYTAVSSVMMDPRTMNATPDQDVLSGLPSDTTTVDTEVEVLKSNALAERVTQSLRLEEDKEFNPYLETSHFFGLIPNKPVLDQTDLQKQVRHERVISGILSKLSVKRQGLTRIITISYTSNSPEKSAKIANEWARLYLSQQLETKFSATKEANDWLSGRLAELKVQVETAETAVQQYKIANNLLNTTRDNTLAQQQISTLEQQLATVKVDQAESDARLAVARRQMAAGSTGEDVGEALNSDVIKNLRAQRTSISQHLADLESKYGPLHPDILKAKHQLDDIDLQIKAEIKRIISNLEAQADVQRHRTASLVSSVGQARGELVGDNKALVKLNELQRNADAVTTLYQSYLDRFKQTSSQSGIDRTDARIVSNAAIPGVPSAPKIPISAAFAFVGASFVATLAVLLRRALDSGITTGAEIESLLQQPYLAGIADLASTVGAGIKASPMQFVIDKPLSVFSEGFRSLRASLIYSNIDSAVKIIAVTSSLPGEGKTTTSVCLAQTVAASGQSVIVIDCDLRRRSINDLLGLQTEIGLMEVLAGTSSLSDALVREERTGVVYLPLARSSYTPRDIFGSEAMDRLLETLRGSFDIIVLDTAPVLPVVDTRILARKADVVVLLARWRKTPRKAVITAINLLNQVGANIAGVALSQINVKEQAKSGYGDAGYYYRQYKKYYAE